MTLHALEFNHNEVIPRKFTCQGKDINPALKIEHIPPRTKALVLIVDDPDAPMGTWVHWVVFNIPPDTKKISEDSVPGIQGINDFKRTSYGGPCPPSGSHRYFFKLYALDKRLDLTVGAGKEDLLRAMEDSVLDYTELIGTYEKK
ncbi:MAG: YbhB/YbcL family Raf kinase inhibitor-like protein [Candidatus Omnitrophica bacterium]|nr:YbhB/YbcL family Raf kinase inhibitor-like protein [Candidatus Omnitrophota bacterium]